MDEDKSREYRELVAKVKLKYRENPICKGNLRLGWCDLVPGEDLCQEINLWTYWQGFEYAKETPHIKYMLLGQDFGPSEKEEVKGTIANVREMNNGKDIMFHNNINLSSRDSQTDTNLIQYFSWIGKPKIDKQRYSEVIVVGAEADVVDYKLISICHKGDIVVSQDYGVAAMALGKGAYAIHQSGKWYTNDNIDRMLMERHLNKKARRASGKNHIKGPKKQTPEDDEYFSESFERMIRMAIQNREGENNGKE